jgi:hypothetical protein
MLHGEVLKDLERRWNNGKHTWSKITKCY